MALMTVFDVDVAQRIHVRRSICRPTAVAPKGATCISTGRGARGGIGGTELGEGRRRISTSMTGSSP